MSEAAAKGVPGTSAVIVTTKLPSLPPTVAETLGSESIHAARFATVVAVSVSKATVVPVPSTETESESPEPNEREIERVSTWAISISFATTLVEVTVVPDAEKLAEKAVPGVLDSNVKVRVERSTEDATIPSASTAVLRSERVVSASVTNACVAEPVQTVTERVSPVAGTNGTVRVSFCAPATTLAVTCAGAVFEST